ncbi:MAG: hypothetical protein IJG80_06205 [Selenomonadaceae bacterium]|nr:hypothetical protein [Selenomonadaceae bacterium]MBQ3434172.1 hypothetical protein [Selenomonadaceae bacterium]
MATSNWLTANSMQFCTDHFGLTPESSTEDNTSTKVTLSGGDDTQSGGTNTNSSISSGESTVTVSSSTYTVPAGTGNITVTTDNSTNVSVLGGGNDSLVFITGSDDPTTVLNSNSDVVTLSSDSDRLLIVSSNVYVESEDDEEQIETAFVKEALLKSYKCWQGKNVDEVTGFIINGANYNLNSETVKCRFVFKYNDGNFYTLVKEDKGNGVIQGNLKKFPYDMSTEANMLKNILAYGNHVGDIQDITSIPAFAGHTVSPFYALRAPSDTTAMPSIRLDLKTRKNANQTVNEVESDIYQLASDGTTPTITNITMAATTTGNGDVTAQVQTFDANGNGSGWQDFRNAFDKEAHSVQFKFTYTVQATDGTDSARVESVSVEHTTGKNVIVVDDSTAFTTELYTVVTDYEVPLQMCYVTVHHDRLKDAKLEAYVNFMHKPKQRELIYLGRANGDYKDFYLAPHDASGKLEKDSDGNDIIDRNIDFSTLKIFGGHKWAGDIEFDDFSFNSEESTITLLAANTLPIYASYDYDHDVEEWRKMTADDPQPFSNSDGATDGTYTTRFTYSLPDAEARPSNSDDAKLLSNVRLRLCRLKGSVKNKNLGTGNGKRQLFTLDHNPKPSTIKFSEEVGSGKPIPAYNYNEDTKILSVYATTNTPIIVSYDYVGEDVVVYSVACGWSIA